MARRIEIYDTTLRDGSQGEGVNFSLQDKLDITQRLDRLGIHVIEGGWPGSNPKDVAYFEAARKLKLKQARIAAFGSTRHAKNKPDEDPNLRKLVAAKTPVITIFGKTWDLHVREALRVSLETNLAMIASSVAYLKKKTGAVYYDAEHFFDGYAANPDYALQTLAAAAEAGAAALILCDTNGGTLPSRIAEVTALVVERFAGLPVGIHPHNDGGMAAANAVVAVEAGASQVQGTINGFGERTGNADLTSVLPALELKLGLRAIGKAALKHLTEVSRYIYETANITMRDHQPYVGRSAFAHKGGIHVSAMARNEKTYEHVPPAAIGNKRRILVSELSGRSNILACSQYDLRGDPETMKAVLDRLMTLEHEGYAFENAEASFDLLVRKVMGTYRPRFHLDAFRVITDADESGDLCEAHRRVSEATVKVRVNGDTLHTVAEGDHGPVDAMDHALRKALIPYFPVLESLHLVDYKVHIVNPRAATEARVRVIVESASGGEVWGTVGVSANIIEASALALVDSLEYMLLQSEGKPRRSRKAAKVNAKKTAKKRSQKTR